MPDTYEDAAIIVGIYLAAAADKAGIDIQAFIDAARASGMTDREIIGVLENDLATGGRIFGAYRNGIKNTVKASILTAGNTAISKVYDENGIKNLRWVTISAEPCPDCNPRDGLTGDMEFFQTIGEPQSGFSVCGVNCKCILVPE